MIASNLVISDCASDPRYKRNRSRNNNYSLLHGEKAFKATTMDHFEYCEDDIGH